MPKPPEALGTPQDVGVVPPAPSRIIPHYEAGQVGGAMQGFARDLGQSANQIQDVQDRLSRAAAEQDFISRKLDIDQQFASDTDYTTAPQRYRQALLQTLNDTSQGILGPVQRADFQQQMSRFTEAGGESQLRPSVAQAPRAAEPGGGAARGRGRRAAPTAPAAEGGHRRRPGDRLPLCEPARDRSDQRRRRRARARKVSREPVRDAAGADRRGPDRHRAI